LQFACASSVLCKFHSRNYYYKKFSSQRKLNAPLVPIQHHYLTILHARRRYLVAAVYFFRVAILMCYPFIYVCVFVGATTVITCKPLWCSRTQVASVLTRHHHCFFFLLLFFRTRHLLSTECYLWQLADDEQMSGGKLDARAVSAKRRFLPRMDGHRGQRLAT
jgi:hypothetical protein